MANLLINTTVGGSAVITTSNIGSYALTSITSGNVTTALGYTPYNATNPSGYITSSALSSYLPLTGGALTGGLYINNADPTIFLQDTDNRSAMIHVNSNVFYVLRGTGTNSTGWSTYNGYWPLELNLENNNALFGGSVSAPVGDFRAPIFYDSANTNYYLDPNSTTALRTVGSWRADSADWDGEYSGKIQYHSNHWYFQSGNMWFFRNAGGSNVFQVDQSGNATFSGTVNLSTLNATTLNASDTNARYYYQSTNGVPSNNLGNPTVTEMALFDEQFNNKTAFYNPASLTFWTSSDGTNYTEYTGFDTTIKKRFLGGDSDSGVYIPNLTNRFRIEVENSAGYVFLNQLYIYWSSNSHSTKVHIWVRRCDNNQWYQWTDSNQYVSSWPGHLYLPFGGIPFYPGYLDSTGHYNRIRIEFIPSWAGGTYSYTGINLMRMQIWGGYPAGKRNIYSTDENQNVSFPAIISATTFSGALSGNATTASALTSMNISQFTNNSGYITGYTETDTLASVTGRGATTASQVSFTQTGDHAISVGTIRGREVGVQTGQFIQLYERVNIGGPSGWGASNTSAPSYGLSVYGGATIGYGNSGGLSVTGVLRIASSDNLYLDTNYGQSIVGVYSASRYQGVFAMGDSYKLSVDGTSAGSLYGLAWTHTNVGGESKSGLSHQLLIMHNGSTQTAIGTGIWTSGLITTTSYGTSANWNTAFGWGNHASAGYLTGITSGQVTGALGYTPYNSSNPSGYITSSGSISGTAGSISGFNNPTTASTANTIVYRDASGDVAAREFVLTSSTVHTVTPSSIVGIYPTTNQVVKFGDTAIKTFLGLGSLAYSSATIPTNNNQLTNGAGYVTSSGSVNYATTAGSAPNGSNINSSYDVAVGNGNGLRFWGGSDSYKISMGVGALYQYGPVTDYSIKTQMNDSSTDRGFTWGRISYAPIAALNANSGDMEVAGYYKSYGYRGNGNVGGTGTASWHPDGAYIGSTMWQYGSLNKNNTGIYGVSEMTMSSGPILSTYNTRNLIVRALDNNADVGILGQKSGGGFAFQIYGTGTSYGFLNGTWASWDIRKAINGAMYMNDNDSYYLQTNSTSNFYAVNIQGSAVVHAGNIGSQSVSNSNYINSTRDTPGNALQYWQASGLGITEAPTADWHNTIRMGHGSPLSYYSNTLAVRMTGSGVGDIYTQTIVGGTAQGWKKHWNDGNDGSGSGLDADLLDGQQGSYYQPASSAITTSNIGSQSVSYATTAGALTSMNISQFTNNSGYITGYTETDTLNSVTGRGNTTSNSVRFGTHVDLSPTASAFRFYDGTTFRGGFGLDSWGHSGSDANLVLYVNGDNTLFFSTSGTKRASLSSTAFNSLVALQQSGNQVLHAGNYTSYSPSLTGSGASGTWNINVTGNAGSATTATNLIGLGSIQSTSTGTSYTANYQVRENSGGGGNTNEIYAPQLAFHWSGVVASSIMMESSGRMAIRNNPGGSYENFIANVIYANSSFQGNLTGNVTGNVSGSAGSVAWTNVSSRPTALSQFTNDLGNYGGFLTSITAHTHAISDVTGLQTALDGKQASGSYAASSHTHDDRYYTESESDTRFARKDTDAAISGNLVIGNGTYGNSTAYGSSGARLMFSGSDGDAQVNYYIGTNHNDYGGNYSKLELRWHTGIRMGAQPGYGGIRFYDTEDLGTVIFSVGTGDSHVRVVNNLYVGGNLALHAGNYNSYSPTLTGTGASGTWSISVSGNAATATSSTIAQQLTKFGDIYGQDWNSYFITGKLIVSNALGHSGANRPTDSYEYGTALSYGETGGPLMQMYFPEDVANTGGAYRALAYRSGYNGSWSAWKTVVNQVGNTCTVAGSNGTGLQVHSNVGYNQNPLTYFLLRGQADSSWKTFKILLTGDAGGQDIEFRRIAENSTDSRMFYVPRGANQVIFDYVVVQPSDSRLKDNLTLITTPVEKIKSLRGVEFDWNSGEHVGTHDVGLIAQDVEAVLPEAVTTQEDGYKNLAYTKVIPLLVEAMKEQQTMIEALRAEIELLKNK